MQWSITTSVFAEKNQDITSLFVIRTINPKSKRINLSVQEVETKRRPAALVQKNEKMSVPELPESDKSEQQLQPMHLATFATFVVCAFATWAQWAFTLPNHEHGVCHVQDKNEQPNTQPRSNPTCGCVPQTLTSRSLILNQTKCYKTSRLSARRQGLGSERR